MKMRKGQTDRERCWIIVGWTEFNGGRNNWKGSAVPAAVDVVQWRLLPPGCHFSSPVRIPTLFFFESWVYYLGALGYNTTHCQKPTAILCLMKCKCSQYDQTDRNHEIAIVINSPISYSLRAYVVKSDLPKRYFRLWIIVQLRFLFQTWRLSILVFLTILRVLFQIQLLSSVTELFIFSKPVYQFWARLISHSVAHAYKPNPIMIHHTRTSYLFASKEN